MFDFLKRLFGGGRVITSGSPQAESRADRIFMKPQESSSEPFKMIIEDVVFPGKYLIVVTGRIESGVIHEGDEVEISGMGLPSQ